LGGKKDKIKEIGWKFALCPQDFDIIRHVLWFVFRFDYNFTHTQRERERERESAKIIESVS